MVTWSNLLDGVNFYSLGMSVNPEMVDNFFTSRTLPALYLQLLENIHNFIVFWWSALTSSTLLLVIFLSFWYLVFYISIKKLRI